MIDAIHRLNETLAALRHRAQGSDLSLGHQIAPGVSLSADPDGTDTDIRIRATGPDLLSIRAVAQTPGRWLTLNFELEGKGARDQALIGLALRLSAPRTLVIRAAIRSYAGGAHRDTDFPDQIVAHAVPSQHTDALWLGDAPALRDDAEWRTLILFLDPQGTDLTLSDLRLFAA